MSKDKTYEVIKYLKQIKEHSYPVLIEDGYLDKKDERELANVIAALDSIKDM